MIPKTIHHIWVGNSPLPKKSSKFIADAKALLPNYNFMFWNETNLSLKSPFVLRCYEQEAWAFVSDYLRFQILFEHGGVYLDTDMELIKALDPLLNCEGFSGLNRQRDAIYCGIIGSVPRHPLIGGILKAYDDLPEGALPTSPKIFTQTHKKIEDKSFDIYPSEAFYPCNEGERVTPKALVSAYTLHHWDESWRSWVPLRRFLRRIGVVGLYHCVMSRKGELKTNVFL